MNDVQKIRMARILGTICLLVGALNLSITAVQATREQTETQSSLLVTGVVALASGIFMLAMARKKPPSGG